MNVTSVRPLNQMAQEGDQEALIWGVTTEMIVVVAEEAMIGGDFRLAFGVVVRAPILGCGGRCGDSVMKSG